ncbi:MAG: hypothetical protein CME70_06240 [Halobacteriovorax sp.]|nr:hypothetical protein [Halobacteriovorax sp.]|tara:strand:- start:982 stop:1359 length:378 start_codon:yes stop_codon:yes gene_type:complete
MLNSTEINQLGDIVNHTWGKSAEVNGRSVTCKLKDDIVSFRFQTIVHFASEIALREQVKALIDESMQILNDAVGDVKSQFKDRTGNTLKTSELSNRDNVELISATVNSPRKVAYYRRDIELEIQN